MPASRSITSRPRKRRPDAPLAARAGVAFTLVEMLVATAILATIVLLLGGMAGNVSRLWTDVNGQNQRRTIGRALLQFMARDLQEARLSVPSWLPATSGATSPLATGAASLEFLVNYNIPANSMNPHAMFWQAPIATNPSQGNIAEIGYFVQWDTTTKPGNPKAYLCRYYTDQAISSGTSAAANTFQIYTSGTAWLTGTGLPLTVAPATPANHYKGWLADNVIALWIRCLPGAAGVATNNPIKYALTTSGTTQLGNYYGFDSRQGYLDPVTQIRHPAPVLPPCVEISLVVVDSNTASKINSSNYSLVTNYNGTGTQSTGINPLNFDYGATTQGSVQYYVSHLPYDIKVGAEIFSTTVFLQNTTY